MDMQNEQIIIAVDREFGSGGQAISRILADIYGIPLYEKNILQLMGLPWNDEVESYYTSDNPPFLKQKTIRGITGTNEERFCAMEFQFLQEQAEEGKSFIVLGHCAGYILADNPHLISLFITANEDFKVNRIMNEHQISEAEARKMMKRHNKKRKKYHNQYVPYHWGDSRHYDVCLSSNFAGIQGSARAIELLIDEHFGQAACSKKEAAKSAKDKQALAESDSASDHLDNKNPDPEGAGIKTTPMEISENTHVE